MQIPSSHGRRDDLDVKMTPMIDVVFLLLVFFVWTASFQVAEQILPSRVSQAAGADPTAATLPPPPEADFPDIVIRITWTQDTPGWMFNDRQLDSLVGSP